jgi:bifunctional DNase/RNase
VQVASLKDETFYAAVVLRSGSSVREVDARPSDALALALRTGSPIYVADEVMERAGIAVPGGATASHEGAGQIMGELQSVLKPWITQPRTPEQAERSLREREQTQHDLIAQVFGGR